MKSATRQEYIRGAWKARRRANAATTVLQRCREWQTYYSYRYAARQLPRTLEEAWAS